MAKPASAMLGERLKEVTLIRAEYSDLAGRCLGLSLGSGGVLRPFPCDGPQKMFQDL